MRPCLTWRRMFPCKDVKETGSEILEKFYVTDTHTMTFNDSAHQGEVMQLSKQGKLMNLKNYFPWK